MTATIKLKHLQQQFCTAMFTDGEQMQQAIEALAPWLDSNNGLSASAQLGIYRSSVHGQFTAALGAIFPVCKRLVGERFFAALCRPYILEHASNAPDIGAYGHAFAAHIRHYKAVGELPYLSDVATLEWAWHQVFNAADQPPLDPSELAQVAPQSQGALCFRPPQASRLVSSDFPVHDIWQRNQTDWDGDEHIDLDNGGIKLLVWRNGRTMRMDIVDDLQWRALELLYKGADLDSLIQGLSGYAATEQIGALLPSLLHQGWIASFSVQQDTT